MTKNRLARLAAALLLSAALASPALGQADVGQQTPLAQIETLAAAGNVDAAYELGERYYYGEGVPVDPTQAVRWYRVAAEAGHTDAQFNLGYAFATGEGAKQSFAEAMRWYLLAADAGHVGAQTGIGIMYVHGDGVPVDGAEAVRWFGLAAADGFPRAQFELGLAYFGMEGVERDLAESLYWFLLAAEGGHIEAMEAAADLYVDPEGPAGLNYPEAMRLYTAAAITGNAAAQYDLGIMYALGEGVPVNNAEAYYWVLLAHRAGTVQSAEEALGIIAEDLSAKQIQAATARADAFAPVGP